MKGTELEITEKAHSLFGKKLIAVSDWLTDSDCDPYLIVVTPYGHFYQVYTGQIKATSNIQNDYQSKLFR